MSLYSDNTMTLFRDSKTQWKNAAKAHAITDNFNLFYKHIDSYRIDYCLQSRDRHHYDFRQH